jgi:hypothetical protein
MNDVPSAQGLRNSVDQALSAVPRCQVHEKPINGTYAKASREVMFEAGIPFPYSYQFYDFY